MLGTRIISPRQPPPTPAPAHNSFVENSSDVFKVKHCVSREDMSLFDRHGTPSFPSICLSILFIPLRKWISIGYE